MTTTKSRRWPIYQNGAEVRSRRLSKGLGQEQLAVKAGITHGHVSRIERDVASAGADVLKRLAEALECEVKDLLA
ncbi:helix-turn-helix domain-containing protein [Herbidospora sp. RD11066]